jgi:hypothetical protein
MGVYLMDVYLIGVYVTDVHLIGVYCAYHRHVSHGRTSYGRIPHLRVFLAHRTRVARVLVSTPRMVEKLLIVGDSAVRLLVTLGARSAW